MHAVFWLKNLKGRDHSEDPGVDEGYQNYLRGKYGGKLWIGCIWLRIGAGCLVNISLYRT
jgi:hypothetical protein